MLRKQHKVDDSHYNMPLIYYIKGHSLHFGVDQRIWALITGPAFWNSKLWFSYILPDEETFRKLCDQDSTRLCLIFALEVIFMGQLLTCPMDDTLFWLVENLEDWNCFPWGEHIWTHLYDEIKNVIEKHSDEHYFGMKKDRMFGSLSHLKDVIVGGLKIQKLYQEHLALQFKDEFSRLGRDFMNSLNILFEELSQPLYTDENLSNDYLVEEELRLCLEAEERMRLEHEKNIIEEQRFRVNEAKRMKLEEEKLLEISELKKKAARVYEFNSCEKHIGKDLSRSFHSLDTVWLTPDIQRFISREGKIKCKFPWSDDYTVGRNFWLTLVCLDPTRKGWLSEEHIDLWVDYMWHGRPDNANWAMVSCYFVQILLQNSTPLFYANGDKYATPWSDVDQHWCLAHFDILSGLVTFYDSGDTYDYESRDLYVRVRECLQCGDDDGFFYFKFASLTGLEQVLEQGPWLIRNVPLILNKWTPDLALTKDNVTKVHVWAKIHKVPVVAYTEDGLSLIGTQIGKPIMLDTFTSSMCGDTWGRMGYARALIEVSADRELKQEVVMGVPLEDVWTKKTNTIDGTNKVDDSNLKDLKNQFSALQDQDDVGESSNENGNVKDLDADDSDSEVEVVLESPMNTNVQKRASTPSVGSLNV
ncbi:phospholipase-like protein [Tanacetum coccineum]|uniref:Phospholipase-like protein n=1 Tax=Tanacetum coccineum TaxID=301880 RepID=A0ABQ5I5J1_9ASTR